MYGYKWRYDEKESPEGCCYDCRMKYSEFPDMVIPDELWHTISPSSNPEGGLLCPTCIASRLDHLGLWYDYMLERLP